MARDITNSPKNWIKNPEIQIRQPHGKSHWEWQITVDDSLIENGPRYTFCAGKARTRKRAIKKANKVLQQELDRVEAIVTPWEPVS
jgi:hypothetical protein